jgi:hypothetical protein
MKISRWILVPLVAGLSMGLMFILVQPGNWVFNLLSGFVAGAVSGLILQLWSERRTKKLAKSGNAEDFSVRQKRDLVLLVNFETAFDFCRQAVTDSAAKIKSENPVTKTIKAKTGMNFYSFGTDIVFRLNPINENLTEIELSTRPSLRTTLVDYGESFKMIEKITGFLKEKDAEINKKVLADSVGIMDEVYLKPFQKEKVKQ